MTNPSWLTSAVADAQDAKSVALLDASSSPFSNDDILEHDDDDEGIPTTA